MDDMSREDDKLVMMVWGARRQYVSVSYEGGDVNRRTWVMIA